MHIGRCGPDMNLILQPSSPSLISFGKVAEPFPRPASSNSKSAAPAEQAPSFAEVARQAVRAKRSETNATRFKSEDSKSPNSKSALPRKTGTSVKTLLGEVAALEPATRLSPAVASPQAVLFPSWNDDLTPKTGNLSAAARLESAPFLSVPGAINLPTAAETILLSEFSPHLLPADLLPAPVQVSSSAVNNALPGGTFEPALLVKTSRSQSPNSPAVDPAGQTAPNFGGTASSSRSAERDLKQRISFRAVSLPLPAGSDALTPTPSQASANDILLKSKNPDFQLANDLSLDRGNSSAKPDSAVSATNQQPANVGTTLARDSNPASATPAGVNFNKADEAVPGKDLSTIRRLAGIQVTSLRTTTLQATIVQATNSQVANSPTLEGSIANPPATKEQAAEVVVLPPPRPWGTPISVEPATPL